MKRVVKRQHRKYLLIGVLVLAASAIFVALWQRVPEPYYDGRPLSQWLEDLDGHTHTWGEGQRAILAIRAMGTNAVPFLVAELRRGARWEPGLLEPVIDFGSDRRARAAAGLRALAPLGLAKGAVPDLARMVEHGNEPTADWALRTLARMEERAHVRAALTNKNANIRELADFLLERGLGQ